MSAPKDPEEAPEDRRRYHAGPEHAQRASRTPHALGAAAPGTGVDYAIDFDVKDSAPALPAGGPANARAKLGPGAAYFDAIRATPPTHEVDGYGGYWAVRRLLDAGLIRRGWQTTAWSGGQWDSRAVLHQLASRWQ